MYKKLLQYDITARAFQTRSTAFEGPMDDVPDEDSPQILHRKQFLRAYLKKLCSDPTRMEFWEYLDKVGMMHTGIGRTHPLHIEYIHIGAGLAVIQDILTEAILSHPRLHMSRKIAIVKALGKVIWIQNDLFTKWYVHDGEEFTDGMDFGEIEKEGWLHGKKVLDSDSDGEGTGTSPEKGKVKTNGSSASPPSPSHGKGGGVCPFTGMSAGVEKLKIDDESGKKDDDAKSDVTEKGASQ